MAEVVVTYGIMVLNGKMSFLAGAQTVIAGMAAIVVNIYINVFNSSSLTWFSFHSLKESKYV
jgi:hypothetical protein